MNLLQQCKADLKAIDAELFQLKDKTGPEYAEVRERLKDVWDKLSRLVQMMEQESR